MTGFLLILLALVVLIVGGAIALYNGLVSLRNRAEGAWSDIDVQLKRRHDLIPNLVATVKGYASHEADTLQAVIEARSAATNPAAGLDKVGPEMRAKAEGALGSALSRLLVVVERYPELKADKNFQQLQGELSSLEEAIQGARRYYNAVVRDYNTRRETFPGVLIANSFGFGPREYFELDEPTERIAPTVDFGE